MDIFNSALRNPVPPIKRESDDTSGGEDVPSKEVSFEGGSEESKLQRKKNSRRKHRNSHLGCGTCKKRRIKCDENLPSCLNCLKGKLHCAYLNLDGPARNALRVAQYHQNLRQSKGHSDSSEDLKAGKPMGGMVSEENGNVNPNVNTGAIPMNSSQGTATAPPAEPVMSQFSGPSNINSQAFAVHYPIMQSAAIAVPAQQQAAHIIQSPYGPLVSLQPMPTFPTYSQVPVQNLPQQMSHIVYPPHPGMLQPQQHPPPVGQPQAHPPSMPQVQTHSPPNASENILGAAQLHKTSSAESKTEELQLPPMTNKNLHAPSQPGSMVASPIMPNTSTSRSSSSLTLPSVNANLQETRDSSELSAKGSVAKSPSEVERSNSEELHSKTSVASSLDRNETGSNDKVPNISKLLS